MRVIVGNNNLANRVSLSNKNRVGRVTFGKIAQLNIATLTQLSDVATTNQQPGDVLVYNSVSNTYEIKTLPRVDGGLF